MTDYGIRVFPALSF